MRHPSHLSIRSSEVMDWLASPLSECLARNQNSPREEETGDRKMASGFVCLFHITAEKNIIRILMYGFLALL